MDYQVNSYNISDIFISNFESLVDILYSNYIKQSSSVSMLGPNIISLSCNEDLFIEDKNLSLKKNIENKKIINALSLFLFKNLANKGIYTTNSPIYFIIGDNYYSQIVTFLNIVKELEDINNNNFENISSIYSKLDYNNTKLENCSYNINNNLYYLSKFITDFISYIFGTINFDNAICLQTDKNTFEFSSLIDDKNCEASEYIKMFNYFLLADLNIEFIFIKQDILDNNNNNNNNVNNKNYTNNILDNNKKVNNKLKLKSCNIINSSLYNLIYNYIYTNTNTNKSCNIYNNYLHNFCNNNLSIFYMLIYSLSIEELEYWLLTNETEKYFNFINDIKDKKLTHNEKDYYINIFLFGNSFNLLKNKCLIKETLLENNNYNATKIKSIIDNYRKLYKNMMNYINNNTSQLNKIYSRIFGLILIAELRKNSYSNINSQDYNINNKNFLNYSNNYNTVKEKCIYSKLCIFFQIEPLSNKKECLIKYIIKTSYINLSHIKEFKEIFNDYFCINQNKINKNFSFNNNDNNNNNASNFNTNINDTTVDFELIKTNFFDKLDENLYNVLISQFITNVIENDIKHEIFILMFEIFEKDISDINKFNSSFLDVSKEYVNFNNNKSYLNSSNTINFFFSRFSYSYYSSVNKTTILNQKENDKKFNLNVENIKDSAVEDYNDYNTTIPKEISLINTCKNLINNLFQDLKTSLLIKKSVYINQNLLRENSTKHQEFNNMLELEYDYINKLELFKLITTQNLNSNDFTIKNIVKIVRNSKKTYNDKLKLKHNFCRNYSMHIHNDKYLVIYHYYNSVVKTNESINKETILIPVTYIIEDIVSFHNLELNSFFNETKLMRMIIDKIFFENIKNNINKNIHDEDIFINYSIQINKINNNNLDNTNVQKDNLKRILITNKLNLNIIYNLYDIYKFLNNEYIYYIDIIKLRQYIKTHLKNKESKVPILTNNAYAKKLDIYSEKDFVSNFILYNTNSNLCDIRFLNNNINCLLAKTSFSEVFNNNKNLSSLIYKYKDEMLYHLLTKIIINNIISISNIPTIIKKRVKNYFYYYKLKSVFKSVLCYKKLINIYTEKKLIKQIIYTWLDIIVNQYNIKKYIQSNIFLFKDDIINWKDSYIIKNIILKNNYDINDNDKISLNIALNNPINTYIENDNDLFDSIDSNEKHIDISSLIIKIHSHLNYFNKLYKYYLFDLCYLKKNINSFSNKSILTDIINLRIRNIKIIFFILFKFNLKFKGLSLIKNNLTKQFLSRIVNELPNIIKNLLNELSSSILKDEMLFNLFIVNGENNFSVEGNDKLNELINNLTCDINLDNLMFVKYSNNYFKRLSKKGYYNVNLDKKISYSGLNNTLTKYINSFSQKYFKKVGNSNEYNNFNNKEDIKLSSNNIEADTNINDNKNNKNTNEDYEIKTNNIKSSNNNNNIYTEEKNKNHIKIHNNKYMKSKIIKTKQYKDNIAESSDIISNDNINFKFNKHYNKPKSINFNNKFNINKINKTNVEIFKINKDDNILPIYKKNNRCASLDQNVKIINKSNNLINNNVYNKKECKYKFDKTNNAKNINKEILTKENNKNNNASEEKLNKDENVKYLNNVKIQDKTEKINLNCLSIIYNDSTIEDKESNKFQLVKPVTSNILSDRNSVVNNYRKYIKKNNVLLNNNNKNISVLYDINSIKEIDKHLNLLCIKNKEINLINNTNKDMVSKPQEDIINNYLEENNIGLEDLEQNLLNNYNNESNNCYSDLKKNLGNIKAEFDKFIFINNFN